MAIQGSDAHQVDRVSTAMVLLAVVILAVDYLAVEILHNNLELLRVSMFFGYVLFISVVLR
jgi:hypothetical protein